MVETKLEVLLSVRDLEQPSITDIKEEVGTSRKNIKDHLDDLEEKEWISVRETQHKHIREITDLGKQVLLDNLSDLRQVNRSGKQVDPYFLHFFSVIAEFDDKNLLPEDWRERIKEKEELSVEEHKDFNRIQVESKKWVYRLTGRSLEVKLRGEMQGEDVRSLKDRAWTKSMEGLDYFEELIGEKLPRERLQVRVNTQHIGARRRNLVKGFIDHLDRNTIWDPTDFRTFGDDGEIRIYCDASGPGGMKEAETGNGGQVNGRMDTAEDDMQLMQDVSHDIIENPSAARRLLDQPSRVDELEEHTEEVKSQVSKQGSALKSVRSDVNQIQSNREAEKDTRDALMELVRSNKQEREKMEERLQTQLENQQEIIERQEEQIGKQSEIIESLQDELEDLRDDRSLEERIRDRFSDHPDFSQVWEHDQNHSLYVWDQRNGNAECKKVLDESMRDLQKIEVEAAEVYRG